MNEYAAKWTGNNLASWNVDDGRIAAKGPSSGDTAGEVWTSIAGYEAFFYLEFAKFWQWTGKLSWAEEQYQDWLDREGHQTWMLLYQGKPVGYFELNTQDRDVELSYFGLLTTLVG